MLKKNALLALTFILAIGIGLMALPSGAAAQGEVKIGVFDLQSAVNQSKKGKAAKNQLLKKFERIQKELKRREAEIERARKDLEKQATMLSPEAKWEKEKDLRTKVRDFQDMYNDYTQEMKREEVELTKPVVEGLLKMAGEVGREKGYTLVLELGKSGVLWIPQEHDLTAEVIKRFDSK